RRRAEVGAELSLGAEPTLVCAGRLNFEKGFDVAIRAMLEICDQVPNARLVVVGDGEEQTALARLADELGLAHNVSFVGRQPSDQVARYMAAADVFLFPTQREEAAPLVLPQAMACGVPVVASAIGGIAEVVGP